jgi:hypothetical protein
MNRSINAVSTLANPQASAADRAAAVAAAATEIGGESYTGNINAPETIAGQRVVGSAPDANGNPGFTLEDGSVVSQATLANTQNTLSAINAFSILNSDADAEDKVTALTRIGIDAGRANNMVSQVAAGNALAGLSLFTTGSNWEEMNNFQRGISVLNSGEAVVQAANTYLASGSPTANAALSFVSNSTPAAAQASLSTLGNVLGTAAVGGMVALDTMRGVDIFQALQNSTTSEGVRGGTSRLGGVISGADKIPGVSNVLQNVGDSNVGAAALMIASPLTFGLGGALGGIASQLGSGKNEGQQGRDSWRSNMEQMGVATKNPQGSHEVTLADGSTYDIGRDGGHRLQNTGENVDGKGDRFTYDVDWSNQTAVESIPEAHIFALATGLDPTSNQDNELFHRSVAQGLNAASSNADTVQGVRDNFRSMMKDVDPAGVAMKIETLRATNKISEQEYGVYLDRVNKIFGTGLTPTDSVKSRENIISSLQQVPSDQLPKPQKQLLDLLMNPKALEDAASRMQARIDKERGNVRKPVPKPGGRDGTKPGVDVEPQNREGLQTNPLNEAQDILDSLVRRT